MKKIGIFGGTFNPVHNEHVNLAVSAIKELGLNKLFVVPDNIPPHKEIVPAENEKRLKMLSLAFSGIEGVEISDYEINKKGRSYTYQTVEYFKSVYPDDELYFLVGADMLKDFKTWKNPERILENCILAVVQREDNTADFEKEREYFINAFGKEFTVVNYTGKAVSSTKVRALAEMNLFPISDVPEKVSDYLQKERVYSDKYSDYVANNLPEKRRIHTVGVIVSAESKIRELNLSPEKVRLSAMLHDCAKYLNPTDYKDFTMPEGVPNPVVHAFLGAYIAENVLKIKDAEIIDAIRFHTSGKAKMTTLGKLIFVADMVEENRVYEGVDELRSAFKGDLDECFNMCLEEEVKHLLNKKEPIYVETLNAYDYYVKGRKD